MAKKMDRRAKSTDQDRRAKNAAQRQEAAQQKQARRDQEVQEHRARFVATMAAKWTAEDAEE